MAHSNLSVHVGVPIPAPSGSSNAAVLTTIPAVAEYLAATPFQSRDIQKFTGGRMNHTYRIHLIVPFQGEETVIIKHSQQAVSGGWTSNPVDVIRQKFEVDAVARVRSWLKDNSPASLVTVPKIHHFDADNSVIIMEDCGVDTIPLTDFAFTDKFSAPGVAKIIGQTLGDFIASLHDWSRGNPNGILDAFNTSLHAKSCTARWHREDLMETVQLAGDDIPALLLDNAFEVDKSDLQIISKIADDFEKAIMSTRDTFIMGDFRPGNIMVKLGPDNYPSRLFVIDWELSSTGPPGVELGRFCCEMQAIMHVNDAAKEPASEMLSSFLDCYKGHPYKSKPLVDFPLLARDVLASCATLILIFIPRSPMPPHVNGFELVEKAFRWLVGSRREDILAHSFVKGFLT